MAHPLDAARLKLDRAEEHLRTFDEESGGWLQHAEFREFFPEDHGDERSFFLRIIATRRHDWPQSLGIAYRTFALALTTWPGRSFSETMARRTRGHFFPSGGIPPAGEDNFNPTSLAGANPRAITLIERMQPYYGGKNPDLSWLWFLRELSNTDKHRTINIVVGQATVSDFRLSVRFPDTEDSILKSPLWVEAGVLHDGAKVATYRLADVGGGMSMGIEVDTVGFITLGQALPWGSYPVSRHVELVWQTIKGDVLPTLEHFL